MHSILVSTLVFGLWATLATAQSGSWAPCARSCLSQQFLSDEHPSSDNPSHWDAASGPVSRLCRDSGMVSSIACCVSSACSATASNWASATSYASSLCAAAGVTVASDVLSCAGTGTATANGAATTTGTDTGTDTTTTTRTGSATGTVGVDSDAPEMLSSSAVVTVMIALGAVAVILA